MSDARVTNVAALMEFRAALAEFAVAVRGALGDVEIEARRAVDWITNDRAAYWRQESRRSADAVAEAKDQLVNARTFKRIGDYTPSCVEEKKALEKAKRRQEHSERKLEAVKHWSRAARRAVDEFQGPVQQLMAMLDGDVPRAMAVLERMHAALESYAATSTPGAISWEDLAGTENTSMARPIEEVVQGSDTAQAEDASAAHVEETLP